MSRILQFPSSSEPSKKHTVTVHADNSVTCTCRGFRAAKSGQCWHVRKVIEDQGIVEQPIEVQEELFSPPSGFIAPMLASANKGGRSIDEFPEEFWVGEEKHDGHRLIIKVTEDEIVAWSRKQIVRHLAPHLNHQLHRLPTGIYDGELIIPGGTCTAVADLSKLGRAELGLFDILEVDGVSCTHLSYTNRRLLLEQAFVGLVGITDHAAVWITLQLPVTQFQLEYIWEHGGEGMIVKERSAPYVLGRSKSWIKFKIVKSAELTVVGFEEGLLGPHAKICAVDDEGNEVTVKSLNDNWREAFAQRPDFWIGRTLVISYQGRSASGKYTGPPRADHFLGVDL